jgi:glycosyltransferase involved in cell wall biosynthesis
MSSPIANPQNPQCQFAMVTLAFQGGGPERDTVLLCNALAERGLGVSILVLRNEGPLRSLVNPAVSVIAIPERRMRYAIFALRRALSLLMPAVVVSSGVPSLNLLTLLAVRMLPATRRPKLVIREGAVPSMACHDPSRSNRIAYWMLRFLYRYSDCVVTLTDGARNDLVRNFSVPSSKIWTMRTNAVIPSEMVDWIERWNGESCRESDLIVCIGRLSAEKAQHTLLHAMTLLPADCKWRLAMIGDGPDRAALEAFARSNHLADRTFFTGYVPDPFAWMMRARVVVLCSIYEGLGNTIIEALACGTPVICSDCPYGPREILQNGRYGTLTPVGDPAALASAIVSALDSVPDRRFLMQRALEYTAEHAATRFLQIVSKAEATDPTNSRSQCFRLF